MAQLSSFNMSSKLLGSRTIFAAITSIAALAFASATSQGAAQTLHRLTGPTAPVNAGGDASLVVEFKDLPENPVCGMSVSFGDGAAINVRVGEKGLSDFPVKITHRYAAPGNYLVKISGKTLFRGLFTLVSCGGDDLTAMVAVGTQPAASSAPTPAPSTNPSARSLQEREEALARREREIEAEQKRLELSERQKRVEERERALREREMALARDSTTAAPPPAPVVVAATSGHAPISGAPDIRPVLEQSMSMTGIQLQQRSKELNSQQYSGKGRIENIVDDQKCDEPGSLYAACGQILISVSVFAKVLIQVPSPVSGDLSRLRLGDEFVFRNCRILSLRKGSAVCDLLR